MSAKWLYKVPRKFKNGKFNSLFFNISKLRCLEGWINPHPHLLIPVFNHMIGRKRCSRNFRPFWYSWLTWWNRWVCSLIWALFVFITHQVLKSLRGSSVLKSLCTVLQNDIVDVGRCEKVNTVKFMQHVLSTDKSIHGREGGCCKDFVVFFL